MKHRKKWIQPVKSCSLWVHCTSDSGLIVFSLITQTLHFGIRSITYIVDMTALFPVIAGFFVAVLVENCNKMYIL